jgi:hypothetical protein
VHTESFLGLDIPNAGPLFFAALGAHVLAGLTCTVSGAIAATARKRPGRHPRAGDVYILGICVVVFTATIMAIIRWEHSAYLLVLAGTLGALGLLGWLNRPSGRRGRVRLHAIGMGGSFIVLLTGFYVDNGANLPVWNLFPHIVYWVIPAVVGIPLIWIGLHRYRSRRVAAPGRTLGH